MGLSFYRTAFDVALAFSGGRQEVSVFFAEEMSTAASYKLLNNDKR